MSVGVSMAVNVSVSQLHDEHRTYFKLMHGLLAGFISASPSKSYVVCKEWNGKKKNWHSLKRRHFLGKAGKVLCHIWCRELGFPSVSVTAVASPA